MINNLLYYPTIEFQRQDYKWLWTASLFWEKIYRIVPDGYQLNEPRNIEELCSTGEIGIPLNPKVYSSEISHEFLEKLNSRMWNAAALEFSHEDIDSYSEYTKIHKDKVDVALRNTILLENENLQDEDWLYVSSEMASIYMTYLANHIATENNLALNTHDENVWTASTFFQSEGSIQESLYLGQEYEFPFNQVLSSIFVQNIIPENILNISPKDLIKFRLERKDERTEFLQTLNEFKDKLSSVKDDRIIRDLIIEERLKVEKALKQYKKSMDLLEVTRWTGSLSLLATLSVDALGYLIPEAHILKPITTGGIGLGLITGIVEKKLIKEKPQYSYLTSLRSLDNSNFNDYNYNLYRKIEEFIND